ncbi:ABC transporter permease [Corynebacterium heidelbergense]|uniref:Taurine ABC transporter permease n=1 Tax=Corynebacterium heidelbergense TaxID=2055947 RepID=A0A364V625_9CORY|nr:ABC transporter permease subunit [Corynebacterium heidelbergense]RAV32056.1 taurine ABC transporter permease [Corynebacterium heidelbergense]
MPAVPSQQNTGTGDSAPGRATSGPGGQEKPGRSRQPASKRPRHRLSQFRLGHLLLFLALLAAWWIVTATGLVKPLFLPSPGAVWDSFVQSNTCRPVAEGQTAEICGEQNYFLWQHLLASLERIAVGVGVGFLVGTALGFLMGTIGWLGKLLDPYLNFLRSLPPLGYIGLLIVWFGIGDVSKVWLLFLAAFPPIAMSTLVGVRGVQKDRILAARSLGASRAQVLTRVILPSALPSILNGLRVATGFAWTTVVAAELNNGIPGIGALAYISGTQLNTPLTICCIIIIGIAAVLLDMGLKRLSTALVPWQGKA